MKVLSTHFYLKVKERQEEDLARKQFECWGAGVIISLQRGARGLDVATATPLSLASL